MKRLSLTLKKSLIGRTKRHASCVYGLGLTRRISSKSIVLDTLENRGMIAKVRMLLEVKELEDEISS